MGRTEAQMILVILALVASTGCGRSAGFRRDTGTGDEPQAEFRGRPRSPTERLESMGQPRKRIVVLDFWNDTPIRQVDLGLFASDELRRGLFNSQRVVIPPDVKSEFQTQDFVQGERVKVAQLIREGRRLGVSAVVIGRVAKIVIRQRGDEVGVFRQMQSLAAVDLELKVFDVAGGREIMAIGRSGEAGDNAVVTAEPDKMHGEEKRAELTKLATRDAMAKVIPDIMKAIEKMSWEGRVAQITGAKVFLNSGKASGLVAGDILKVITPGDEVYDPETGAFLGRADGQLKGTVEVIDFVGPDAAVAEVHTGGGFQEGDSVQLY